MNDLFKNAFIQALGVAALIYIGCVLYLLFAAVINSRSR